MDKAFARIRASVSCESPVQRPFGREGPESALLKSESIARLLAALSELPERERVLLRGRYFEGRSLDALATELGISKSWASRLYTQALAQLRKTLEAS
jgi:RNA polymerase sigma factor for flagellar operon FliA